MLAHKTRKQYTQNTPERRVFRMRVLTFEFLFRFIIDFGKISMRSRQTDRSSRQDYSSIRGRTTTLRRVQRCPIRCQTTTSNLEHFSLYRYSQLNYKLNEFFFCVLKKKIVMFLPPIYVREAKHCQLTLIELNMRFTSVRL